jgi:hypothetical protein
LSNNRIYLKNVCNYFEFFGKYQTPNKRLDFLKKQKLKIHIKAELILTFPINILIIPFPFSLVGLDKIEFLQSHEKMEIYEKAFNIIQTYFGNDEEDQQLAPTTDNNQFQFNADQSVPMDGYQF